ncbi:MAG: NRDE family protein [Phycisphaerales bacterium]|nr:NRDE family protein [Phycisphaerales bacterium]
MCTVSLIPLTGEGGDTDVGLRMACNRDESRLRLAALPPAMHQFGAHRAILPVDPASGGTWIGANDRGLVATLLNVYTLPYSTTGRFPGRRSRGALVPQLLEAGGLEDARQAAGLIDAAAYPPFRLVAADRGRWFEAHGDGAGLRISESSPLLAPRMFTSSGLGDERVAGPRSALFEDMFSAPRDQWVCVQDEFHAHRWPDAPHLSVCMERAEALTVSFTTIEIGRAKVQMAYTPGPPGCTSALPTIVLPLGG